MKLKIFLNLKTISQNQHLFGFVNNLLFKIFSLQLAFKFTLTVEIKIFKPITNQKHTTLYVFYKSKRLYK